MCRACKASRTDEAHNNLLLCLQAWGGGFLVSYILNIVPPQLLSILPLINYIGVHLLIGLALQFFDAPSAALLDTILPLLDGATRAHAIFIGVNLPNSPAVVKNMPALAGSFTLSLLLGTVAASGGGQTCFTIGAFNPDGWALTTPPILKARNLLEATDVWAPFLGALAYQVMTFSHPAYAPFVRAINAGKAQPILKPQGAKALVTFIVSAAFAWRAAALHWLGKPGPVAHATSAAKTSSTSSTRVTRRQANGEKTK